MYKAAWFSFVYDIVGPSRKGTVHDECNLPRTNAAHTQDVLVAYKEQYNTGHVRALNVLRKNKKKLGIIRTGT